MLKGLYYSCFVYSTLVGWLYYYSRVLRVFDYNDLELWIIELPIMVYGEGGGVVFFL